MTASTLVIELLDQEEHECLHAWELEQQEEQITIGRSADCTVVLANRFVSRLHARLIRQDGGWLLETVSDQGVWLGGRSIERGPVAVGDVFKLGSYGPSLRLGEAAPASFDNESTIRLNVAGMQFLALDRDRRDRDVEQIAEGDFFRQLASNAEDLKKRMSEPVPRPHEDCGT